MNPENLLKCSGKYIIILCVLFFTNCQQFDKDTYTSDFRTTLSVIFAESMFSEGYYYEDGKMTAHTLEELQKMFIKHGSNEMFSSFNTIRSTDTLITGSHEHALGLAALAKSLDLPLNPQLWLCPNYSDISGQEPPDFSDFPELNVQWEWTDLNLEQMQSILFDYGALVARDILNTGVTVNIWDLGNETDYGFAGVGIKWLTWFGWEYKAPDAVDPEIGKMSINDFFQMPEQERITWLQQHIWKYTSKLFKALADGIKSVYPDARFSTHIATSARPEFAVAYFQAMNEGGYFPDELGLSYYPTNTSKRNYNDYKETVLALNRELGKKVYLGEFAYPAGEMTGYFKWNAALDGYPLTDEGQAAFIKDMIAWGYGNKLLSGIRPWGADFLNADWLPMSFFNVRDKRAIARPGLDAIQLGLQQAKKHP